MSLNDKVKAIHLHRYAVIYVRQSTAAQVQCNRESTDRQYRLQERAVDLGWSPSQIKIVDEDLARSGSGTDQRHGFATMITDVALGNVGLILSLEVSRVARNNADWYRLLDLCGITDTLIGDEDGLYHPGLFNDRLLLGLKGTMAEAELHVIRARLEGGIRNKAARGELRRGLPMGFIWGDDDGEVLFHPDQAVTHAITCVFEKFDQTGSVRQVWLWFRDQNILFPSQQYATADIRWVTPTYTGIHQVLTNPCYAGVYTYGKTHQERYLAPDGRLKKRTRMVPQAQWSVFIKDHHQGFIDWDTYEMNRKRIANNTRPMPHQAAGALREGSALLQGLATCGQCGRKLLVYYQCRNSSPGYYCAASNLVNGRGMRCLRVGAHRIDTAVAAAFLETVAPAGIEAALQAEQAIDAGHDAVLAHWQIQVERARYEVDRAERRYRAVEPENRLVARSLEREWEHRLSDLAVAEVELARQKAGRATPLSVEQRAWLKAMGKDLHLVWSAASTTDRDRKELLQALLSEVCIVLKPAETSANLTLHWRGGLISEITVDLASIKVPPLRTDEETVDLVRRLAVHYPDAVIAGILNRQGRRTVHDDPFTVDKVGNLRRYWKIARFVPSLAPPDGELATIAKTAEILEVAPSTIHRWLADGFIAGEQITPGAPWQIRITDDMRNRFVEQPPSGYVPILDAIRLLGVSRQTVLQRVNQGSLDAAHVRSGRRKGLYINVLNIQQNLFDTTP